MSVSNEKVYYAVGRGREIGIYDSWKECKARTDGFCNAKYRKFYSLEEAKEFVNFWKNYSTPVKGENEAEGRSAQQTENSSESEHFTEVDKQSDNPNSLNSDCGGDDKKPESYGPSSHSSNSKKRIKDKLSQESSNGVSQGQDKDFNEHSSHNNTLEGYSDFFSASKTFATSTQKAVVKVESEATDRQTEMEPHEVDTVGEDIKMCENSLKPQQQLDVGSSPSKSPSVISCSHLLTFEGRLTEKDVTLLALNLRLDSFERRFDSCLKEIGAMASDISHLRSDIREVKEALKFVQQPGSSKKGKDGLLQTKLNFGNSPSGRDSDTEEPERKRGRTVKRKLSTSNSFTEGNVENLFNSLKPELVDMRLFTKDSDGFVEVYTDGSALSNGTREAKAGIGICFGDNHPLNVAEPVVGPATSITAEIQAARVAMQLAIKAGVPKLKIKTDSEFLINCATKWIPNWKRNGWILKSGGPVKNRKELEKLDFYASKLTVRWEKVPAHSNVKGNETADRLANAGAARYER